MPSLPPPVSRLLQSRRSPVVVQTVRSAAAATIAYAAADALIQEGPPPLLAPLTALLVVQVTLFATVTMGVRRINSVIAGVTLAVGFSAVMGLSWWSLGLLIICSLTLGHLVRAGDFVPEVAISAMLVLGVTHAADLAIDRIIETLIGAFVGLLFNFVIVPPVWTSDAEDALLDLARRMRRLMWHMGEELGTGSARPRIVRKLHEARRLDHDITEVDASLRQAEESLRFNPRVREGGLLSRVVLRTGLDTLEICAVLIRTISRNLADLAAHRGEEPMFEPEEAAAIEELFAELADTVQAFAVLVTSTTTLRSERAEARLQQQMDASRAARERVAHLLLDHVQEHPKQWQLHGALLAEVDQMLDELDVEARSRRLADELDRQSRERYEQGVRGSAVVRRARRKLPKRLRRA